MTEFEKALRGSLHSDRYRAISEHRDWDVADVVEVIMKLIKEKDVRVS